MPKNPVTSTRDALLAAAREEFAEHGIAGARVDRIAGRAGVNKERIYGYFGNKEKLFDAVVKEALDEFAGLMPRLGDDPVEYVGQAFDHYIEHPELLRLLMWEALYDRTDALPDQEWRIGGCGAKVSSLAARLGEEPSPAVGRTVLSLLGLAMMPLMQPQLAELLGAKMDSPEAVAAMREHVTRFARTALGNRSSGEPGEPAG